MSTWEEIHYLHIKNIYVRGAKLTTYQGLSLDTFEEKTMCCLLLEVSRLSLGVLNGFELLLTGLWPLIHDFGFICISDVRELQGGDAGDREVLHIEPCRRSIARGKRHQKKTLNRQNKDI